MITTMMAPQRCIYVLKVSEQFIMG